MELIIFLTKPTIIEAKHIETIIGKSDCITLMLRVFKSNNHTIIALL